MEYSEVIKFLKVHKDLIVNNNINDLFDAFPEQSAGKDLLDLLWGKGDIIGTLKGEVPPYFACNSQKVTSIILPNKPDFTLIGPYAFSDSSLRSIIIPSNIETIGEGAFSLCKSLREVTLNPGLKIIEKLAFSGCDNLKIIFNGSAEEWNNIDNDAVDLAFNSPYKLEANFDIEILEIPNTIRRVKSYKFAFVNNIRRLITNCRTIGSGAFFECINLYEASIHSRTIYDSSFENCKNLQQITLGLGVTYIKEYAFAECTNLRNIVYEGNIEEFQNMHIDETAFQGCPKIKVECEDGVLLIND